MKDSGYYSYNRCEGGLKDGLEALSSLRSLDILSFMGSARTISYYFQILLGSLFW